MVEFLKYVADAMRSPILLVKSIQYLLYVPLACSIITVLQHGIALLSRCMFRGGENSVIGDSFKIPNLQVAIAH